MRVSIDPEDPGYAVAAADSTVSHFDVVLDGQLFNLGPVITADEELGVVVYAITIGNSTMVETWPDGRWKTREARGAVRVFKQPHDPTKH